MDYKINDIEKLENTQTHEAPRNSLKIYKVT